MFFELNFSLSKGCQAGRSWKITSSKSLNCQNLVLMLLGECELRLWEVMCWSQKVKILPRKGAWLTVEKFALHSCITRVMKNVRRQPAAPQVWNFPSSKIQLLTEPSGLFKNWRFKHFSEGEPLPRNSNQNQFQAKTSWPKPAQGPALPRQAQSESKPGLIRESTNPGSYPYLNPWKLCRFWSKF